MIFYSLFYLQMEMFSVEKFFSTLFSTLDKLLILSLLFELM